MNTIFKLILIFPIFIYSDNGSINLELSVHLKDFQPYIGKKFKGEFFNSTPDNPLYDITSWERILNGKAIRITHSVNNGEYGGETIIMWDPNQDKLISRYFTTAGTMSLATMKFDNNRLISIEDVSNNQNGIKKIKTIIQFIDDGKLMHRVKYQINNIWQDAHEIIYYKIQNEPIIFK